MANTAEAVATACTFEKRPENKIYDFVGGMDSLIRIGTERPHEIGLSDWYYMKEHAEKCPFCFEKFKKLAAEHPEVRGPKTLA